MQEFLCKEISWAGLTVVECVLVGDGDGVLVVDVVGVGLQAGQWQATEHYLERCPIHAVLKETESHMHAAHNQIKLRIFLPL